VLPIFRNAVHARSVGFGVLGGASNNIADAFQLQPDPVTKRGPRMIRVIIDTVLFSCMAAMVTGVVIVAASLLI
jgi:hypothetical protein